MESIKKTALIFLTIIFGSSVLATYVISRSPREEPEKVETQAVIAEGLTEIERKELWEQNIIDLHNSHRQELGLDTLVENETLNEVAKQKAMDMVDNCYWAHEVDGVFVSTQWVKDRGYQYLIFSENLGKGFTSESNLFVAWLNSKTHRDNIEDKFYIDGQQIEGNHKEIGVYVDTRTRRCNGQEFINTTVVLFGTRKK